MTAKPKVRRSHLVPKFYLRGFCNDPNDRIWVGDLKIQKIYKTKLTRASVVNDAYAAEEGIHEDILEDRLSRIESDAAPIIQEFTLMEHDVTPELGRFIAWLAARTGWMRRWAEEGLPRSLRENAASYLALAKSEESAFERPFEFVHIETGRRERVPLTVALQRVHDDAWNLAVTQDQHLDMIRLQAHIFLSDHFPRLKWIRLLAPVGYRFVTSDRPVCWDILGAGLGNYPGALRDHLVELTVPLRSECALVAGHDHAAILSQVWTVDEINRRTTAGADRFIYGSTEEDVQRLLPLGRRERQH